MSKLTCTLRDDNLKLSMNLLSLKLTPVVYLLMVFKIGSLFYFKVLNEYPYPIFSIVMDGIMMLFFLAYPYIVWLKYNDARVQETLEKQDTRGNILMLNFVFGILIYATFLSSVLLYAILS